MANHIVKKFTNVMDLPPDVVMNLPRINIIGNIETVIENHKGIVKYNHDQVSVRFKGGLVVLVGRKLKIEHLNKDEIKVEGFLTDIKFETS